jgi:MFS family permease
MNRQAKRKCVSGHQILDLASARIAHLTLAEVSRNPTFWVLFGTFFVCGLSTSGLIQTHFISLCGDYGLAAVPAASVLAMIAAFDFLGTIMSGWLSDRFDNRKLLFWYYGLRGLSAIYAAGTACLLAACAIFLIRRPVRGMVTASRTSAAA